MTIRAATPADAEAIARVHVQAWHESYRGLLPDRIIAEKSIERRTALWRSALADPARAPILRVIEDAGEVVGFGSAGRARSAALGAAGEIAAIYLLDRVKRRGFGRALFGELRNTLEAAGYADTGLWVLTGNTPARRFYEALGGRAGATRSERDADHVLDEIAYRWDPR
jgi:ribosomal protein S18 acetylase RimI-like enzyme